MGRQAVLLGYDCWLSVMAAIGTMAGRSMILDAFDVFSIIMFLVTVLLYLCISIISLQMILRRCRISLFHTPVMMKRFWRKTQ